MNKTDKKFPAVMKVMYNMLDDVVAMEENKSRKRQCLVYEVGEVRFHIGIREALLGK